MTTNITVTDARAPAPSDASALTRLWPLGAFVAFNGPSGDGERRRAVVVTHDEDAGTVDVRDGTELVTLDAAALADAVLVARSADEYVRRVGSRARALGRENGREDVARTALARLARPRDEDVDDVLRVRVTTVHELELTPHLDFGDRPIEDTLGRALRAHPPHVDAGFFGIAASEYIGTTVEVVDAFTTSEEDEDR